jgi:hypothetical protein
MLYMSAEADMRRPADEANSNIYLPAVSLPPNFGRLERVVSGVFDLHGVVRLPSRSGK